MSKAHQHHVGGGERARHQRHHIALKAGLEAMGLKFLVKEEYQLPQMNAVLCPEGVDEAQVRSRLLGEFGLEIGAGLGPLAGKIWRIGLMGETAKRQSVAICVEALKEALARVRPTLDLGEAVRDVDLIFETVPEVVGAKHAVLARAEAAAPESAIIATNTSSIMIGEIGRALARPGRLIGTHWFYPANVMPLVEVARSAQTAQGVVDTTVAFLTRLRKKPVVVNDAPGFFTTRFINLFIAEAMRSVEQGICGIAEVQRRHLRIAVALHHGQGARQQVAEIVGQIGIVTFFKLLHREIAVLKRMNVPREKEA